MRQLFVFALFFFLILTTSCQENRKMIQAEGMTPTTDSLCLDILGLRLGETYSEEDVFDILASRIDSLIRLQDMRGNNLIHDNPHMVRINKDGIIFAIARGARKDPILEWKGIPWSHLFIYLTESGVLYRVALNQNSLSLYDQVGADSVFRKVSEEFIDSFGKPVYSYPRRRESTYFSFRTGKIENNVTGGGPAYNGWWSDGKRVLDFGYGILDSFRFTAYYEDITISNPDSGSTPSNTIKDRWNKIIPHSKAD